MPAIYARKFQRVSTFGNSVHPNAARGRRITSYGAARHGSAHLQHTRQRVLIDITGWRRFLTRSCVSGIPKLPVHATARHHGEL